MMQRGWAVLLLASVIGCETGDAASDADLKALVTRVGTLESQLQQAQTDLIAAQETLLAVDDLFAVMSVNEDGDIVISGANLYVQSGGGRTDVSVPNGKGNLVLGYAEELVPGVCSGGSDDGESCTVSGVCSGGECVRETAQPQSGSHNLIMGTMVSYEGWGSVVMGAVQRVEANSALVGGAANTVRRGDLGEGDGAVVFGISNEVDGRGAAVLGGFDNRILADGPGAVVVGGAGNTASHSGSVVLGGEDNVSSAFNSIDP